MVERKKINWLLILQGWAMLWVVIGHSPLDLKTMPGYANGLYHFAYSFHMPLFMLVSGFLFYLTRLNDGRPGGGINWSYYRIFKDKALRLLLPGFVFSFLAFVLKTIFSGEMERQTTFSLREIIHSFLFPGDNPFAELWFIATLFWLMMLAPLWKLLINGSCFLKWGMAAVLAVLHFWYPHVELLCIGKVFSYAIWFYMGLLISEEGIVERFLIRNSWTTLAIGIVIYGISYVDYIPLGTFIATVGGINVSLGLALVLDKYLPKAFFTFRNYTYQIFLMGIFAQIAVKIAYRHINIPYIGAYMLCILAGLYVPVVVSKFMERINWKPLLMCVGLKPVKK